MELISLFPHSPIFARFFSGITNIAEISAELAVSKKEKAMLLFSTHRPFSKSVGENWDHTRKSKVPSICLSVILAIRFYSIGFTWFIANSIRLTE